MRSKDHLLRGRQQQHQNYHANEVCLEERAQRDSQSFQAQSCCRRQGQGELHKKKNEVRKKVVNCLGGGLDFTRETLLEGKLEVAFIGKEGKGSKKTPIRTTPDFPSTEYALTKDYAFVSNPCAFNDGRDTSKTVDLCMFMGMDVNIEPLWKSGGWTSQKEESR